LLAVICKVDIHLPAVGSLKAKRSLIRKIKARTENHFSVVMAEVGVQDLLQRTELGFAYVGSDAVMLNSLVDKTISFIDELGFGETLGAVRETIQL